MYGLIGKMTAIEGQRETLIGYLLEGTEGAASLPGCILYVVCRATDDHNAIWITEVWENQAAHQASLGFESTQALIAKARPIIAGMSDRVELDPVGGKGLPNTPKA